VEPSIIIYSLSIFVCVLIISNSAPLIRFL
jgi:hypothetical protein